MSLVWQIPRYILTLHELLAHTPHEHVERNSLDYAKSKLEELSRYIKIHPIMIRNKDICICQKKDKFYQSSLPLQNHAR